MSMVDDAIVEIDAALADLAPKLEGLDDYAALDLKNDTRTQIDAARTQYNRRKTALLAAKSANEQLVEDEYPTLIIPDVSLSVLADLQENAATIAAALAQFRADPAVRLDLTADDVEPR